ncbi:hypothetical protein J6590_058981 [Homalodisca vitripennis]|nr:hypothetical protein J6590_058981 [Homalodisca vitripennis]
MVADAGGWRQNDKLIERVIFYVEFGCNPIMAAYSRFPPHNNAVSLRVSRQYTHIERGKSANESIMIDSKNKEKRKAEYIPLRERPACQKYKSAVSVGRPQLISGSQSTIKVSALPGMLGQE